MKNLKESTLFILLLLGLCFHASFQTFEFSRPETVLNSAPLVQYSEIPANACSPTELVCLLSNEAAQLVSSDTYANSASSFEEFAPPTYTEEFTLPQEQSKIEKTALTIADVLTIVSRVIIALAGAIFGTRKALSKLN